MPKDDFYTPTDIDTLRMENELLAFEVRFLKARLAGSERSREQLEEQREEHKAGLKQLEQLKQLRAQLEEQLEERGVRLRQLKKRKEQLEGRLKRAEGSIPHLESAEEDLVLLLRRLASSPLAWAFRFKQDYRDLEKRYLDTDD